MYLNVYNGITFGKIGKRSKRNKVLKSELGGLFTSLKLYPFMFIGKISGETDFDTYRKSGTYHLDGAKGSLPFSYGGLIVFNCDILIVQIGCNLKVNDYYIRNNWNNEKWTPWAKIGTTDRN